MSDSRQGVDPSRPGPVDVAGAVRARSGTTRVQRKGGLPFGAVMATGAAAQLAELVHLDAMRLPLLWLTILVAGLATMSGVRGRLANGRGQPPPAATRFGQFTIPVGLAVIGVGLARTGGPVAFEGAVAAVVLAWATTLLLTLTVAVPAATAPRGPHGGTGVGGINGVWFIAPAAYLADAAGTAALVHLVPGTMAGVVRWLAVLACGIGVVSYVAALLAAVVRVGTRGLSGAPRVAWWIVVGCGGLAADALGHVGRVAPFGGLQVFGAVALVCWVLASLVLLPVGIASARHLFGLRHLSDRPPWPPAFSTAVYALGTAQVAELFHLPWAAELALVAAVETLLVWVVTSGLHVAGLVGRLHPRGDAGTA